jgi:hypothetical protein
MSEIIIVVDKKKLWDIGYTLRGKNLAAAM